MIRIRPTVLLIASFVVFFGHDATNAQHPRGNRQPMQSVGNRQSGFQSIGQSIYNMGMCVVTCIINNLSGRCGEMRSCVVSCFTNRNQQRQAQSPGRRKGALSGRFVNGQSSPVRRVDHLFCEVECSMIPGWDNSQNQIRYRFSQKQAGGGKPMCEVECASFCDIMDKIIPGYCDFWGITDSGGGDDEEGGESEKPEQGEEPEDDSGGEDKKRLRSFQQSRGRPRRGKRETSSWDPWNYDNRLPPINGGYSPDVGYGNRNQFQAQTPYDAGARPPVNGGYSPDVGYGNQPYGQTSYASTRQDIDLGGLFKVVACFGDCFEQNPIDGFTGLIGFIGCTVRNCFCTPNGGRDSGGQSNANSDVTSSMATRRPFRQEAGWSNILKPRPRPPSRPNNNNNNGQSQSTGTRRPPRQQPGRWTPRPRPSRPRPNRGQRPNQNTGENFGVASEVPQCTEAGRQILQNDGTAADAAIAVLLCVGVARQEAIGIGGGFLFLFYNRTTRRTSVIDAREIAPAAAHDEMFRNQQELAFSGPQSIAVPGQIAGFTEIHRKFGRTPWSQLFNVAIELAENGCAVDKRLDMSLKEREEYIRRHKALRDVYVNPTTNRLYKMGEVYKQPALAKTLRSLAESQNPRQYFYNEIAQMLLDDINDQVDEWNGTRPVITLDDFRNYKTRNNRQVVMTRIGNLQLHTMPLPGSGNILTFILRVMEQFDRFNQVGKQVEATVDFWHRLVETWKFAYSKRGMLGDNSPGFDNCNETVEELMSQEFVDYVSSRIDPLETHLADYYDTDTYQPEDHGTSHVAILDKFGNAASVTSTINTYFGSKVLSPSTGIVLNNEMDDFTSPNVTNAWGVPPTLFNHISPGKRPMSSMVPSVFVNPNGDVRLVIGGAGGTTITTAVSTVAIRHLWVGEDIRTADRQPRLHHQLFPPSIFHEQNFDQRTMRGLREKKHNFTLGHRGVVMGLSVDGSGRVQTNAVRNTDDQI